MSKYFPLPDKEGDPVITSVGKYSVTHPDDAERTSEIIAKHFSDPENIIVTDGTSGVGGNVISFAKHFKHVNAIEILPEHCEALKHNISLYELSGTVDVICNDFETAIKDTKQHVIFLDPPWGGPDYKQKRFLRLYMGERPLPHLLRDILNLAKLFVIKVPNNFDFGNLYHILPIEKITAYKFKKYMLLVFFSKTT
jgi:tRNA G37 N-methylase Trm5